MNRITLKEYMDIMSEGWNIDLSDTKHITRVGNKYFFTGNGEDYSTVFSLIKDNQWIIKFGRTEGSGINIEMVGGIAPKEVINIMSSVSKSIVMFIRTQKPESISYVADRVSRKKAYLHIIGMLRSKPEIKGYYLENRYDTYYYLIRNDVKAEDVIPVM